MPAATIGRMNASRESFRRKADAFGAVVGALGPAQWAAPSPCAGWSAADVVDHVIDTEREFLAGHDVDLGPRPAGDPAARWTAHRAAVLDKVDDTVLDRGYDGYFGRTTIGAMLVAVYGFDLVVHRWDVARAAGGATSFTDAEMDELEASLALFGDNLYAEGICGPPVPVPADASRQDRLLGVLGRDPRP